MVAPGWSSRGGGRRDTVDAERGRGEEQAGRQRGVG